MISWPPVYQIKRHARAKHVRLRPISRGELLITVPNRFKLAEIPGILDDNRAWITKQLLSLPAESVETLPNMIPLRAMGKEWKVVYVASDNKLTLMERPHGELVLVGNTQDMALCKTKLVSWLRNIATHFLSDQLHSLSADISLPFESVCVRDQKTLWGSCTSAKDINLNYKLIFLPARLARHVMVHELCHTRHLNHSVKFWDLVTKFDIDWEQHRRELRKANQYMPAWLSG
jgi:predicted metal-dependent hydrolase